MCVCVCVHVCMCACMHAVYQAAALSKGFRVKTFLIKDANTFPVEVRVMSDSVVGKR